MQSLPTPSSLFTSKKSKILSALSVPSDSYTDLSPKGSVDQGIRHLIDEINVINGLATTSSCAGRVSVFLEGRKALDPGEDDGQIATPGGKGGGGTWLLVSHDPVKGKGWVDELGLVDEEDGGEMEAGRRLIHFKFEPMILHVLTTSLAHAQFILRCALIAGFRESGTVSLETETPIVGIRSMGLGFESLIGYQSETSERRIRIVSARYLHILMSIADERFVENQKRIERFRDALKFAVQGKPAKLNAQGEEWEDAAARKERKRAEGLRRRAEAQGEKQKSPTNQSDESTVLAQSLSGI